MTHATPRTLLALASCLLLASCASAQRAAPNVSSPATNAADLDTRAFALLDAKPDAGSTFLDDPVATPLDAACAAYLEDRRPVVELLRTSAALPRATWPGPAHDMHANLGRAEHVRACANLLLLQSRYDLGKGRPEDAASDLLAAMALGRHVGSQGLFIDHLVEWGVESMVIDQWGRTLQKLPKVTLAALPVRLAQLPAPAPIADAFAAEYAYGLAEATAQNAPQFPRELLVATKPFYDAVGAAADKPSSEVDKVADAEVAKLPLNPFLSIVSPSVKRVAHTYAVVRSERLMLDAAIGILVGGPGSPPDDPYASPPGPFTFEKTDGGFRLAGAARWPTAGADKPATLDVGATSR